jgi:hypothetical protein
MNKQEKEKIKVFELDFGDTNLVSPNAEDITAWIESDLAELKSGGVDELNYTIKVKLMTQKKINNLPEWA